MLGTPMTPTPDAVAALASVKERHRARTNDPTTTSITICDDCEQLWPCDISVIVAALVPAPAPRDWEDAVAYPDVPAATPTSEREAEIRRLHAPHPPMDDQQLRCDGCDLLAILKTCRAERDVARTERAYWKDAHSGERDAAKVARAERERRETAEAALRPYLRHMPDCNNGWGETAPPGCTCGLRAALRPAAEQDRLFDCEAVIERGIGTFVRDHSGALEACDRDVCRHARAALAAEGGEASAHLRRSTNMANESPPPAAPSGPSAPAPGSAPPPSAPSPEPASPAPLPPANPSLMSSVQRTGR